MGISRAKRGHVKGVSFIFADETLDRYRDADTVTGTSAIFSVDATVYSDHDEAVGTPVIFASEGYGKAEDATIIGRSDLSTSADTREFVTEDGLTIGLSIHSSSDFTEHSTLSRVDGISVPITEIERVESVNVETIIGTSFVFAIDLMEQTGAYTLIGTGVIAGIEFEESVDSATVISSTVLLADEGRDIFDANTVTGDTVIVYTNTHDSVETGVVTGRTLTGNVYDDDAVVAGVSQVDAFDNYIVNDFQTLIVGRSFVSADERPFYDFDTVVGITRITSVDSFEHLTSSTIIGQTVLLSTDVTVYSEPTTLVVGRSVPILTTEIWDSNETGLVIGKSVSAGREYDDGYNFSRYDVSLYDALAGEEFTVIIGKSDFSATVEYGLREVIIGGIDLSATTEFVVVEMVTAKAFPFAAEVFTPGGGSGITPAVATGTASVDTLALTAVLSGTVDPKGSTTTYKFEYGVDTTYGSNSSIQNIPVGQGWLHTSNLKLLQEDNSQVVLYGAQITGFGKKADSRTPTTQAVLDAFKAAGFTTARFTIGWNVFERIIPVSDGLGGWTHTWDTQSFAALDQTVALFTRNKIRIIFEIHQSGWSEAFAATNVGMPVWMYPDVASPTTTMAATTLPTTANTVDFVLASNNDSTIATNFPPVGTVKVVTSAGTANVDYKAIDSGTKSFTGCRTRVATYNGATVAAAAAGTGVLQQDSLAKVEFFQSPHGVARSGVPGAPWDLYREFVKYLMTRYKDNAILGPLNGDYSYLIGVDLMNEPGWPPTMNDIPPGLGYTQPTGANLNSLYEYVGNAVTAINPKWLLIWENGSWANMAATPQRPPYPISGSQAKPNFNTANRSVMSWHYYPTAVPRGAETFQQMLDREFSYMTDMYALATTYNVPFWVGEHSAYEEMSPPAADGTPGPGMTFHATTPDWSTLTTNLLTWAKNNDVHWSVFAFQKKSGNFVYDQDTGIPRQYIIDVLKTGILTWPDPSGGLQTVNATISGLAASTSYHYRISATNANGTSVGSDATFTTSGGSTPNTPIEYGPLSGLGSKSDFTPVGGTLTITAADVDQLRDRNVKGNVVIDGGATKINVTISNCTINGYLIVKQCNLTATNLEVLSAPSSQAQAVFFQNVSGSVSHTRIMNAPNDGMVLDTGISNLTMGNMTIHHNSAFSNSSRGLVVKSFNGSFIIPSMPPYSPPITALNIETFPDAQVHMDGAVITDVVGCIIGTDTAGNRSIFGGGNATIRNLKTRNSGLIGSLFRGSAPKAWDLGGTTNATVVPSHPVCLDNYAENLTSYTFPGASGPVSMPHVVDLTTYDGSGNMLINGRRPVGPDAILPGGKYAPDGSVDPTSRYGFINKQQVSSADYRPGEDAIQNCVISWGNLGGYIPNPVPGLTEAQDKVARCWMYPLDVNGSYTNGNALTSHVNNAFFKYYGVINFRNVTFIDVNVSSVSGNLGNSTVVTFIDCTFLVTQLPLDYDPTPTGGHATIAPNVLIAPQISIGGRPTRIIRCLSRWSHDDVMSIGAGVDGVCVRDTTIWSANRWGMASGSDVGAHADLFDINNSNNVLLDNLDVKCGGHALVWGDATHRSNPQVGPLNNWLIKNCDLEVNKYNIPGDPTSGIIPGAGGNQIVAANNWFPSTSFTFKDNRVDPRTGLASVLDIDNFSVLFESGNYASASDPGKSPPIVAGTIIPFRVLVSATHG